MRRTSDGFTIHQSINHLTQVTSEPDIMLSRADIVHTPGRCRRSCPVAERLRLRLWQRNGGMKCNLTLNRSDYASIHSVTEATRRRQCRVMMPSSDRAMH